MGEAIDWRRGANSQHSNGKRARPEDVIRVRAGINGYGGDAATVRRVILRALVRGVGGWRVSFRDSEIERRLGLRKGGLKNEKKREFIGRSLARTPQGLEIAADIALKLGLLLTDGMISAVFSETAPGAE